MARVFLAQDEALGRRVVVKILARDLTEGLSTERFRREIHLAAQLQHPHLVPVLQAGEAEGLPYFVMPYVAGDSLRERLAGGTPLPMREAVAILRDVARAMAYAHEQGVVHRDIKPGNVLLASGSAMVSDFGIAKALSSSITGERDSAVLTRTGSSLGTPTYMAPEQAAADPDADHRVDLYAFGVMAYELFTGRPPFHGRSPQALLTAHLVEIPPDLSTVVPKLPRSLAELVMQCLQKDPDRRPGTAQEIVQRLDEVDWSGERVVAPPVAGATPLPKRRLVVGALVVTALAIGGGWIWRSAARSSVPVDPQLVTVVPFRVASADPALHYLREGMLDLLAAKLPGEGGLRATEPRTVLDAWHAAGGREGNDLSTREADRLARRLGSGWLLLGDVVGTPSRVTLNAALFPTGGGEARTRVSVEGPPDSLGGLVDQLVGRLLTTVSEGGAGATGSSLTQTSLPALRAYLDGVSKLRRGLPSSVEAFHEAIDRDSSFALAALGLVQATSWWNDQSLSTRGVHLAWENRSQLSARDQALLLATVGPRYPGASSSKEVFEAAQKYLQLAPDRAEAWYILADKIYHLGEALGMPDRARRSAEGFQKALALDSNYVPGYIHLQQLAAELGDTALDRRLMRMRLATDTAPYWLLQQSWYRAVASGDSARMNAVWDSIPRGEGNLLYLIARMPLFVTGAGTDLAIRALDSLIARSLTPDGQRQLHYSAASILLLAGRPAAAQASLEGSRSGPDDIGVISRQIMDAVVEAGDSAAAALALPRLVRIAESPAPRDPSVAEQQRSVIRAVLTWRLNHGDTTGVRALLARLKAGPGLSQTDEAPSLDLISLTALEALYAERLGSPGAPAMAVRLDSLLENADYTTFNTGRLAFAGLAAARLLEKYQGPAAALKAVRRRSSWWSNEMPYLAVQLREEGRLGALAGARDEAIDSYRHYLSLRNAPEPKLQKEVDDVRRELARLESGRAE
jgi:eukaryotic-like serine/threonine-protein kinase